jgi:hypothetical protein
VLLSECDVTAAREASDQGSRTTLLDQAARTAREALEALSRPEFQAALDATDHEIIDRANRVIDSAK